MHEIIYQFVDMLCLRVFLLIAKPPLHQKNAFSLDQGVEQILEIV